MGANEAYGLIACVVCSILFGSMFVPVKNFESGDGFFVQFCVDFGIFIVGIFVNLYMGSPTFHPLAMIGGALWAIGNATAVPILSTVGMGMGMLLWSITNCLIGWATSRFGLFGTKPRPPANSALNYIGLVCVLIGGVFFSLVEPSPKELQRKLKNDQKKDETSQSLGEPENVTTIGYADDTPESTGTPGTPNNSTNDGIVAVFQEKKEENAMPHGFVEKATGVGLALVSGLFYGTTFVPVQYIQNHPEKFANVSQDNLAYVHAHFTGHLFLGLLVLVCYTIFKRNKPFVNNQIMIPAMIGGVMWGIGCTAWFIASNYVSQAVSFPINTMVPGCCATLWSGFLFREIRGVRNYILAACGLAVTISGAIMVGASS